MKKLFNIREGWPRDDDTTPHRVLHERLPTGVAAGVGLTQEELHNMIAGYYRAKGWADDGGLSQSKLAELGLLDLVKEPAASTLGFQSHTFR